MSNNAQRQMIIRYYPKLKSIKERNEHYKYIAIMEIDSIEWNETEISIYHKIKHRKPYKRQSTFDSISCYSES